MSFLPERSSKMLPSVAYLSVRHVLRHCLYLLLALSLLLTNFPLPEWKSQHADHNTHLIHSRHRHHSTSSIVAEAKALKKLKKLFKMKKLSKYLPFLLMGPKIIIIQKNSGGGYDSPNYGNSYGYGGGRSGGAMGSLGYYASDSSMMDESNSYSSA